MMNQVVKEEECAVMLLIKILGRKWIPWILCELLSQEEMYFSDLLKQIKGNNGEKISSKVLAESLRILEDNQIIIRTVNIETMPIRVKYSLTEKGGDFRVVFGIVKGWSNKWGESIQECRSPNCIRNSIQSIDIDKTKNLFRKSYVYSTH